MPKFMRRHLAWFLIPLACVAVTFLVHEFLAEAASEPADQDLAVDRSGDIAAHGASAVPDPSGTIATKAFEEKGVDAPRPKDFQPSPRATAKDQIPVAVSFRIVTHQGDWAGGANGRLWVGAPQGQGLYKPVEIAIEGGVSQRSIRLLPGYWGMYLSLEGCVEEGNLRFMLDADAGPKQCLDFTRPLGGGTVTGRALDGEGVPLAKGTQVFWTARGEFSDHEISKHSQSAQLGDDGRFKVKWQGSVTNLRFGVRRQLTRSERVIGVMAPYERQLLDEGETWDIGDVNTADLPLLFSCKLQDPPKTLFYAYAKVLVRPPHSESAQADSVHIGDVGINYAKDRELKFYGEIELPLFEAELLSGQGTWKSQQVIAKGAEGVPMHFTRTAVLSGKLLLPRRELYDSARVTLRSKQAVSHVAKINKSNGGVYFSGVWPGAWMLHVRTALGWEKPVPLVVNTPTGNGDLQIIPTIDLRERWAVRSVKVVDEHGEAITTPTAVLLEASGQYTKLSSAVNGEVLIHYPKAKEPLVVHIRAAAYAYQSYAFKKLPETVTLSQGYWVTVDPGFNPREFGDRLEWTFDIDCRPDQENASRYFPESLVESDTPVTMGPFPAGELTLSLNVRGYDRKGKPVRMSLPGGVRRTRLGSEPENWSFPPGRIQELNHRFEKRR